MSLRPGTPVVGSLNYSVTNPNPNYPTGITVLHALFLTVIQKPATANGGGVTTPSGWTLVGSLTGAGGYSTTLGADTGNMNVYVYQKDTVTGTETGALGAITTSNNSVAAAWITRVPHSGGAISVAFASGSDTSAGNVSITAGSDPGIAADDLVIFGLAIPTDVTTPSQFSAQAITATGATFGTAVELNEPDSSLGNDLGGFSAYAFCTAGTSSAAPVFTATAGGTTTNVRGPGFVLRIRETATQLYFRALATTGIGTFRDLTEAAGAYADPTPQSTTTTASGTEIQLTSTAGGAVLEWISPRVPAGGFTLAGQMTFSVWMIESTSSINAGARARVFKRTAAGSESEIAGGPFDDGVELGTSITEMVWTGTPTSTAFAEDDRIVVRLYATNIGTMAAGTASLKYNAAAGTSGDSYFLISEDVAFKPEPGPTIESVSRGVGAASDSMVHTIVLPATVNANDMLVAVVSFDGNPTVVWDNVTAGTWETPLVNADANGGQKLYIIHKVTDGSEDGASLMVATVSSEKSVYQVYRISGADTGTAPEVATATNANNADPPSLSPSWGADDTLWLFAGCNAGAEQTNQFPLDSNDPIEDVTGTVGNAASALVVSAWYKEAGLATYDPDEFTQFFINDNIAATIAFKPANAPDPIYRGNAGWAAFYKGVRSDAALYLGDGLLHS